MNPESLNYFCSGYYLYIYVYYSLKDQYFYLIRNEDQKEENIIFVDLHDKEISEDEISIKLVRKNIKNTLFGKTLCSF